MRGFVISALGTDRGREPREPPAPSMAPSWHESLLATPPRSISAPAALGQAQTPSRGDRGDRGDRDCYMTNRYQERYQEGCQEKQNQIHTNSIAILKHILNEQQASIDTEVGFGWTIFDRLNLLILGCCASRLQVSSPEPRAEVAPRHDRARLDLPNSE